MQRWVGGESSLKVRSRARAVGASRDDRRKTQDARSRFLYDPCPNKAWIGRNGGVFQSSVPDEEDENE